MSVDFAALAKAVVSGVPDVRACLIVSRDGLGLGAHPASEEEKALAVWSRVAALGDVERGFVALRDEVWAFCRRGPYTALATAHPSARAGLVIDRLDQMLLAAEEARVRKEAFRPAPEREATTAIPEGRGPRTPLHRETKTEEGDRKVEDPAVSGWIERLRDRAREGPSAAPSTAPAEPVRRPDPAPDTAEQPSPPSRPSAPEGGEEVDTFALSREFAGLLAERAEEDER